MKTITRLIIIVFCCLTFTSAQEIYFHQLVLGSGGGASASTSYRMVNTFGQTLTGIDSSAFSKLGIGFWHQYNAIGKYYAQPYAINSGWNMISVPKKVADYRKTVLFPSGISYAFAYNGSYQVRDTLQNGVGYWLKFNSDESISYTGVPKVLDTIFVNTGWNMIGSIGFPVNTSNVIQIPANNISTNYFGYNGYYYPAAALEPGKSYWVKAKSAGQLILNISVNELPIAKAVNTQEELDKLNELNFEWQKDESNAIKQTLYFGIGADAIPVNAEQYSLPPIPPEGATDIRFASDRYVEMISNDIKTTKEFPILFSMNDVPIKLEWEIKDQEINIITFVERKGTKIINVYPLASTGKVEITPTNENQYYLMIKSVPREYALYQNYPNPFNPKTAIEYQLPYESNVKLEIYNVLGQLVEVLSNAVEPLGYKSVEWNAGNYASGIYFYSLEATSLTDPSKSLVQVKKMMLVK